MTFDFTENDRSIWFQIILHFFSSFVSCQGTCSVNVSPARAGSVHSSGYETCAETEEPNSSSSEAEFISFTTTSNNDSANQELNAKTEDAILDMAVDMVNELIMKNVNDYNKEPPQLTGLQI